MKKILLLSLLVLVMASQIGFCANTSDAQKNAKKQFYQSQQRQHNTCLKVANNFRYDHQFASYMKYRCQLFESDRQRMINSIFTSSSGARSNSEAISSFTINLNNNEINTYKSIAQEYCKYNSFKFAKYDKQACSQQRINSLFQTTP
jgi:hypothetical protein